MRLLIPNSPKAPALFSPSFAKRTYRWAEIMKTDGVLAAERQIAADKANSSKSGQFLCVGVVIQSEFTTSNAKANPFGKAAVCSVPFGLWLDVKGGTRVRLDRVFVLFVLPESSALQHKQQFERAKGTVENIASWLPDVDVLIMKKGWSVNEVANHLRKRTRKWLKGVGRPTNNKT